MSSLYQCYRGNFQLYRWSKNCNYIGRLIHSLGLNSLVADPMIAMWYIVRYTVRPQSLQIGQFTLDLTLWSPLMKILFVYVNQITQKKIDAITAVAFGQSDTYQQYNKHNCFYRPLNHPPATRIVSRRSYTRRTLDLRPQFIFKTSRSSYFTSYFDVWLQPCGNSLNR